MVGLREFSLYISQYTTCRGHNKTIPLPLCLITSDNTEHTAQVNGAYTLSRTHTHTHTHTQIDTHTHLQMQTHTHTHEHEIKQEEWMNHLFSFPSFHPAPLSLFCWSVPSCYLLISSMWSLPLCLLSISPCPPLLSSPYLSLWPLSDFPVLLSAGAGLYRHGRVDLKDRVPILLLVQHGQGAHLFWHAARLWHAWHDAHRSHDTLDGGVVGRAHQLQEKAKEAGRERRKWRRRLRMRGRADRRGKRMTIDRPIIHINALEPPDKTWIP